MAWEFERVAGPFEGSAGGVIWDSTRDQVLFCTVDEGRLLWLDHASKAVSEFRRYANRVNGLARGPNGEIYGAQEGGRLLGRLRVPGLCTNFAWGDDDWRSLYYTTYHGVHRTRLNIPGVPVW